MTNQLRGNHAACIDAGRALPSTSGATLVCARAQRRAFDDGSRCSGEEVEVKVWWPGPESNWRHYDFQSYALPTELPSHPGVHDRGTCPLRAFPQAEQNVEYSTLTAYARQMSRLTLVPALALVAAL